MPAACHTLLGVPSIVALRKKILPFEVRKPRLTTCKINILPAVSSLWAQFFHTFNAVHHHPFHFSSITAKPRVNHLLFIFLLLIYDNQGFRKRLHHSELHTVLIFLDLEGLCVLSSTWSFFYLNFTQHHCWAHKTIEAGTQPSMTLIYSSPPQGETDTLY